MTAPKKTASPAATSTPGEALDAAVVALVAAAEAFAAADGPTTHSHVSGNYIVRFQGEQLLAVERR